jgi:hypothetical protein
MTRDEGFQVADVSTSILDDPKVRALVRLQRDPSSVSRAVVIYVATVTASWAAGCRVSADEAVPLWMDPEDAKADMGALVQVGLLDDGHRVPSHAWEGWFAPARNRRDAARAAGREGNRRRWHPDATPTSSGPDRHPITTPSGSDPRPFLPSVPTVPTGAAEGQLSDADRAEALAKLQALADTASEPAVRRAALQGIAGLQNGSHAEGPSA